MFLWNQQLLKWNNNIPRAIKLAIWWFLRWFFPLSWFRNQAKRITIKSTVGFHYTLLQQRFQYSVQYRNYYANCLPIKCYITSVFACSAISFNIHIIERDKCLLTIGFCNFNQHFHTLSSLWLFIHVNTVALLCYLLYAAIGLAALQSVSILWTEIQSTFLCIYS